MAAVLTQRPLISNIFWNCDTEADINTSATDGFLQFTKNNSKWWKIIGGVAVNVAIGFNDSVVAPIPAGGTTGQSLNKKNNNDFEYEWVTPSGGSTPDVVLSKMAPTADVTITAGYSAVVNRMYTIPSGVKLIIGSGAIFRIL